MSKSANPGEQTAKRDANVSSPGSHNSQTHEKLHAFFVRLASDLDFFCRFVMDPRSVAKQADLSEEDESLLFSGDQGRIYIALRPDLTPDLPKQPPAPESGADQCQPAPMGFPAGYSVPWPWSLGNYVYCWPVYSMITQLSAPVTKGK